MHLGLALAWVGCSSPNGTVGEVIDGGGPVLPADTLCTAKDWCWVRGRPLYVGGDQSLGTLYALGDEGNFFRWTGTQWASAPVPTDRALLSAWVASETDVWVTDEVGSAWHGTPEGWTETTSDLPLGGVFGRDGVPYAVVFQPEAHGGASALELRRYEDGSGP